MISLTSRSLRSSGVVNNLISKMLLWAGPSRCDLDLSHVSRSRFSTMIDLAITGSAGRMGQRLIALAKQDGGFHIVGAVERPEHAAQARDAGEVAGIGAINVPITFDLKKTPNVLIDFTHPTATRHWLKTCRDRGIALVIGTTGLQSADHASIDQAAADIPIIQSPNMSLRVTLLFKLAAQDAPL